MILSERLMVERRWAIEMVVLLPLSSAPSAWLTRVSDSASRADVAGGCQYERHSRRDSSNPPSSKIRISGFLTRALAIAIRCF